MKRFSSLVNYKDLLEKTKLVLASRGKKKFTAVVSEFQIKKESEDNDVRLRLSDFRDIEHLWELKTELGRSSDAFVSSFYKINPDIYTALKRLTFAQVKQAREKQAGPSKFEYFSLFTGNKNTYLYVEDSALSRPSTVDTMSLNEAMQKLKQHHTELMEEWKRPQPKFIIPKQSMVELNWYPSPYQTLTEQFEEYRQIFIAPERQKRETLLNELRLDLEWFAKNFSKRKKYCSTVRWRNKNIWSIKRLLKRRRRVKYRAWSISSRYSHVLGF